MILCSDLKSHYITHKSILKSPGFHFKTTSLKKTNANLNSVKHRYSLFPASYSLTAPPILGNIIPSRTPPSTTPRIPTTIRTRIARIATIASPERIHTLRGEDITITAGGTTQTTVRGVGEAFGIAGSGGIAPCAGTGDVYWGAGGPGHVGSWLLN